MKRFLWGVLLTVLASGPVSAGPIIIDGTDSDDHGFFSAGNQQGWFYIQRGLQNLLPQVTNGGTNVVVLGATGSTASQAITSAANVAGVAPGNLVFLSGGQIDSFLTGVTVSGVNLGNTKLIYTPSSSSEVGGGISPTDQARLTLNANAINNFVNGGGGLFTHTQGYGFLSALLPGIVVTSAFDTGLTLTADGTAAFPGLSNADLSAGPFHNYFSGNFGGLKVLFVDAQGNAVGLGGGAGGSITETVPEPATMAVFGLMAVAGAGYVRRRKVAVAA